MTDILAPGTGIFFMRVGTHAQETLEEIVARKSREIEQTGYTFWGYGGSTCHPVAIVQPFARDRAAAGKPLYLCMEEMKSERYFGEPLAAAEFSADGHDWQPVPPRSESWDRATHCRSIAYGLSGIFFRSIERVSQSGACRASAGAGWSKVPSIKLVWWSSPTWYLARLQTSVRLA